MSAKKSKVELQRELAFMNREYMKVKAERDGLATSLVSSTNTLNEITAGLRKVESELENAVANAKCHKSDVEWWQGEDKKSKEKTKEWRAFAAGLAVSLHAIEGLTSGPAKDDRVALGAVGLLVEAAKRKPVPTDPELPLGMWQSIIGGVCLAMMGMRLWAPSRSSRNAPAAAASPSCPIGASPK